MSENAPTLADLAASLRRVGLERLYLPQETATYLSQTQGQTMPSTPMSAASKKEQPFVRKYRKPDPSVVAEKRKKLAKLEEPLRKCQECRLHAGRTNLVYSDGNPDADLMFIGEGPGADEDRQGVPFVGRAGRLLTDMIVKGMKLPRESVYIGNIVKCRPPENRNPEVDEMAACLPNLLKQVEIVQPKVIVTLGAVAAKGFLKQRMGITRLRGNWLSYQDILVMPTLHPAYLLRNPAAKKDCWEDLKQVIAFFNGELKPTVTGEVPSHLF